jgi:hypothetical protein
MHPNKLLFTILTIFSGISIFGQSSYWTLTPESGLRATAEKRQIIPKKYAVYTLNTDVFLRKLTDNSGDRNLHEFVMDFPHPDGSIHSYRMTETPVFDPALSAKYPGFTSYTGRGVNDAGQYLKMSISPYSIHVMISGVDNNSVFIDPYVPSSLDTYVVYYKKDYERKNSFSRFSCGVTHNHGDEFNPDFAEDTERVLSGERQPGDCNFRRYRLALACTGEYAQFHGGTIERVLDAYNVAMTRINGVYERELALTMVLIPNTDRLIFLNPATDPYTNNNGEAMLLQNQTTINNIIGFNNYDIGHVFSTGGGGIASLGSPCTNRKAQGVTGQPNPINDAFTIDFVAHEMGHQFGANHTQNNNCARNPSTAMEPGSGSTIMGYAGICSPNVQNNSHDYFHAVSLGEMSNFITTGSGATCGEVISIANSKPLVTLARANYSMPVNTAFYLTATGSDADNDALTYTWEQMDNQTATMPPQGGNASGPAFRSLPPSTNPTRFFPDLQRRYNTWEVLPTVARTMRFRCTVRDNNPLGGCTHEANVQLNFISTAGPFVVTNPNTASVEWRVGTTQTVTWNVANTDVAPINCSLVTILLSSDGGATYPDTLASAVPNTGTYPITVPNRVTTRARVMVIAHDHIFFDVSNFNFRISSSFNLTTPSSRMEICDESLPATVVLNLAKFVTNDVSVNLTASSPVEGLNISFSDPNPVAPSTVNMVVSGLENLNYGDNPITVTAQTSSEQISLSLSLFRTLDELPQMEQLAPANYANLTSRFNILFECRAFTGIPEYEFEISTSPDFSTNVTRLKSATGRLNTTLADRTVYYWRVRPLSTCGNGDFSGFYSFRTGAGGPAVLLTNRQILINPSEKRNISVKELNAAGTPADQVRFVIAELPRYGYLSSGDSLVSAQGFVFTLQEIQDGTLHYNHNGGEEEYDYFVFNLINPAGLWLPNNRFNIRIRQSNLGIEAFTQSDVSCFGASDGRIFADVFGGIPPYLYSLDGVQFGPEDILSGLPRGTYSVYVQDANETVVRSESVSIDEPAKVQLTLTLEGYNIRAAASGGVPAYTFSLNGSEFKPENLLINPGNGIQTVQVMDQNGCVSTDSISLSIPELLFKAEYSEIRCFGDKFQLTIIPEGGIPPYNYSINNNPFVSSNVFSLPAGTYVLRVRDSGNKIVESDLISVEEPDALSVEVTTERFSAIISAIGGSGGVEYSLDGENFDTTNIFTFPKSGLYPVYIRDEDGCSGQSTILINVLDTISVDVADILCYGLEDGSLEITAPYGTPPFDYILVGEGLETLNSEDGIFENLSAGPYSVIVRDAAGDMVSLDIAIREPDPLVLTATAEGSNLRFSAEGGTPPYTYSIDDGINFFGFDVFPDLPDNLYFVAVKDKNGCVTKGTVNISVSVNDENLVSGKIKVWPNPVNDVVMIHFDHSGTGTKNVTLTNSLGLQVMNKILSNTEIHSGTIILDFARYSTGMYILQFTDSGKTFSIPVIKI